MTKQEKLLEKAKNNPNGLSFEDFQTLMKRCGWVLDHQKGESPNLILAEILSHFRSK